MSRNMIYGMFFDVSFKECLEEVFMVYRNSLVMLFML
jgi:hypothetical protein